MEKTLTINDVFYFVNQAMEREYDLKVLEYININSYYISFKDFEIGCNPIEKTITIRNNTNNSVYFNITDIELAQFRLLWEKVKLYSQDRFVDKFLKYFTSGDNAIRTLDQIDD